MTELPPPFQVPSALRGNLPRELEQIAQRIKHLEAPLPIARSALIYPLFAWSGLTLALLIIAVYLAFSAGSALWMWVAFAVAATAWAVFFIVVQRIQSGVLEPLFQARRWIGRVMAGEAALRVDVPRASDCAPLLEDINALGDMLGFMCNNMDRQTRMQMEQLAQKTKSLEILYDAAAGLDVVHDLDELLTRFLHTLRDLVQARAGTVRLMADEDKMRLVASVGFDEDYVTQARLVSVDRCLSGSPIADDVLLQTDTQVFALERTQPVLHDTPVVVVTIPIRYSGKNLGAYNFFLSDTRLIQRGEITNLFGSVGRHLGIAIEKARLERHARRLSIIEERTMLANELHDSLAQTLASLRFQVNMAEETVSQSRERAGIRQVRTIKDGLDQANSQLRELLAHFRTRMDERGLIPAIDSLVDRFKKETGISAFFQNEARDADLPPALEVQVLHIVQEALTNIRKHSQAQHVRVLLRSDDAGEYHVLVEDDGQGIEERIVQDPPGEHIGLSIMRERAARLGGQINIESELGEGTRVDLVFHVSPRQRTRRADDELEQDGISTHE